MKNLSNIAGIDCVIERKNIRRLSIYIKPPDGEVIVRVPVFTTMREVESFVSSKAEWIRKHQEAMRAKPKQVRMALDYISGETLYFWGKPYGLSVEVDGAAKRGKLVLDPEPAFGNNSSTHGNAILIMPQGNTYEQRERLVKKKYKELLDHEAERVLTYWSERTGLEYSSWHSRYMKSRWGSLSVRDRRVCLNTRLAEKPEICLTYVALHEIAHIREANHGPRFKAILDEYMPGWREVQKMLKS